MLMSLKLPFASDIHEDDPNHVGHLTKPGLRRRIVERSIFLFADGTEDADRAFTIHPYRRGHHRPVGRPVGLLGTG